MARPVSTKPTGEEETLEESTESLLSLSLRARELQGRGEWERGGEMALRGALFLGAPILRDKLRHMGRPPRAKSSSASDPSKTESLSCMTCMSLNFPGQNLSGAEPFQGRTFPGQNLCHSKTCTSGIREP